MFSAWRITRMVLNFSQIKRNVNHPHFRTFLSPAYYCNEVWEQRLQDPIIKSVNIDVYYNDLDQKYQKQGNISAIDVDIFANAIHDGIHTDELLDLIHKLRLSADTGNTLDSTSHAVIRYLLASKKFDLLLQILDDRLNYGVFLDHYTANLLLDSFWKEKDYVSGARTAGQLMLQEDFVHPLNTVLSLLHCYNFLLEPKEWPRLPEPEEPEEEVKVRVKYLRNPYNDNHFDLRDPFKIVGKTLVMATKPLSNPVEKSLHLVGLTLWENSDQIKDFVEKIKIDNEKLLEEAINLIPDTNESKKLISEVPTELGDIQKVLQDRVKQVEQTTSEKDIAHQCDTYARWLKERELHLEEQNQRYLKAKRLINIEETQKSLKEREKLLWFFENEDKIDLEIESKEISQPMKFNKKSEDVDEEYIPPEVKKAKV